MTESLKLAEIHRSNIDYERQRHLVNWLIKSGPHMNGSAPTPGATSPTPASGIGPQQQPLLQHAPTYYASIGQPTKPGHEPNVPGGLSRASFFNSQTNLPLHIMSGGGPDGAQPKLRRFNSHDTSANMFSVADFENARLARRNELEYKQRQQQHRYKMNSLSSGTGDCSTGDSKGSKFSADSSGDPMPAERFLDRFTLPRVVRITTGTGISSGDDTIASSGSSHGSSSGLVVSSTDNGPKSATDTDKGELCMLYKQVTNRAIYHGFSTKHGSARKKGVQIPQEFQGYFSLVNDKGATSATQYSTLVQLVRERVYKFLSVDNMPAYTETQSTDTFPPRAHYVKGTAHGGQIYRLLAVFEDGKQDGSQTTTSSAIVATPASGKPATDATAAAISSSGLFRDKDKGRYAQLLNEQRQVVYVALTAKGKFYEIEPSTPQMLLGKTPASTSAGHAPLRETVSAGPPAKSAPNADCVYRLEQLIASAKLPLNVRLISGPTSTVPGCVSVPDQLTVSHVSHESVVIGCPIDDAGVPQPLRLRKLVLPTGRSSCAQLLFGKCTLGFENEQKMFLNQTIQNILKYCQLNVGAYLRLVHSETLSAAAVAQIAPSGASKGDGLKILRPLNFPRLLRREKSTVAAHEKEDSIIFLSKNDLENMDQQQQQQQKQQQQQSHDAPTSEQNAATSPTSANGPANAAAKKSKWFRRGNSTVDAPKPAAMLDAQTKRQSLDRYQDMSKLLHERFGDFGDYAAYANCSQPAAADASDPVRRPLSEIGAAQQPIETGESESHLQLRQKSMSMQDMQESLTTASDGDETSHHQQQQQLQRSSQPHSNTVLTNFRNSATVAATTTSAANTTTTTPPTNAAQQSFISAKLYTEFHVKTRQHSKSSSQLHNLLHFSVPHKMNVSETQRKPSNDDDDDDDDDHHHQDDRDDDRRSQWAASAVAVNSVHTTSIEDDLPYSNVRDSLVAMPMTPNSIDEATGSVFGAFSEPPRTSACVSLPFDARSAASFRSDDGENSTPSENIYAEICAPVRTTNAPSRQPTMGNGSSSTATTTSTIYSTIEPGGPPYAGRRPVAGSTIRIAVPAIRTPLMASIVGVSGQSWALDD